MNIQDGSTIPKTQYWSLEVDPEGLLSLYLNLTGVPAEDAAAQLWALHEMVSRRCESDREAARIGSSEESDPDQESDRIGSNRIEESDPDEESDEVHLTCPEIAAAVGISTQAVHKRIKSWLGGRRRNARGGGREYPISALPNDWQLKVSAYVSLSD